MVGVLVLAVHSSIIVLALVVPVVGGVTAGCFLRGNPLGGAVAGLFVGILLAVTLLRSTWSLLTDQPVTGGAGLGIALIFFFASVVAVVWVGLALLGGVLGAVARDVLEI